MHDDIAEKLAASGYSIDGFALGTLHLRVKNDKELRGGETRRHVSCRYPNRTNAVYKLIFYLVEQTAYTAPSHTNGHTP